MFTALSTITYAQSSDFQKSPETVCARFIDCMKNADFDSILELYAYHNDAIVKNIDPKAYSLRLNALTPFSAENLPADYFRLKQIKMCSRFGYLLNNFCFTLLLPTEFNDFIIQQKVISLEDNRETLDEYLQSLDTKRLKKLELVRLDLYRPDVQKLERHQNNVSVLKKIYKFNDKVEYVVLYKLDDSYYAGGITFSKFGNKWYIDSLTSSLANLEPIKKIDNIDQYLSDYELSK